MSANKETDGRKIIDYVVLSSPYSVHGAFNINGVKELSQKGYVPIGGACVSGGVASQGFALYEPKDVVEKGLN